MAEWSIAAVLKTVVGVSPPRVRISAPPLSFLATICWFGELAELVECGGLENRCRRKMTGGSNPPLSAGIF